MPAESGPHVTELVRAAQGFRSREEMLAPFSRRSRLKWALQRIRGRETRIALAHQFQRVPAKPPPTPSVILAGARARRHKLNQHNGIYLSERPPSLAGARGRHWGENAQDAVTRG